MNPRGQVVGRVLLVLVVAIAGRASAAPALRPKPDDGPVDLTALHQLIEKARPGSDLPEADLVRVRSALGRLMDRVDALENLPAGHVKGRKLPAAFDRVRTARVEEAARLVQKHGVVAVGRGGQMIQCTGSVLLVSGDAEVIQCQDCVVVAGGKVRLGQSSGCVVVAGKLAEVSQSYPRPPRKNKEAAPEPGGTVAVAGERMKWSQSKVGVGLVLRPAGGKDEPAVESLQSQHLLLLNAPADWKSSQDENCRAEALKTPVAK